MAAALKDPSSEEWVQSSPHRTNGITIKRMLERDAEVGGFELSITNFEGADFHAVRHTHAFDQLRIGLEGGTKYGPLTLRPRVIGYFPAGTLYGPQTVDKPTIFAALQYDGSGDGYFCTLQRLDDATAELRKTGAFEKGYYQPNDGERLEAWQASFHAATGRRPIIPEPRFAEPIFMRVDSFPWKAQPGTAVQHKKIGIFGEPQTRVEMLLIPKGESVNLGQADHPVVGFVLEGALANDDATYGRWSSVLAEEGDTVSVRGAADQTELIVITLPALSGATA